jgi:hypothetical protein
MSAASTSRSRLVWPLAALALVGAIVAGILNPVAAFAAPVALSGIVHDDSNKLVAKLDVTAIKVAGTTHTVVASTKTSTTGAFSFAGLVAGDYTLRFAGSATSFPQYLGGTAEPTEAQVVPLTDDGSNESSISVALAASGTVTGSVKTAAGTALSKYTVTALTRDDSGDWVSRGTATSNSKGAYAIASLEPGDYILRAQGDATAAVFSGNVATLADATKRGVFASKTTTVSLVAGATGTAQGTIVGASGSKLGGIRVTAYRLTASGGTFTAAERTGASVISKADGTFSLAGIAPGAHTLRFEPPVGSVYGATFLGGSASPLTASMFYVSSGITTAGMDAALSPAASVAGTVKAAGSLASLADIAVALYPAGSVPGDGREALAHTTSDANGHYAFDRLSQGSYVVYAGSHTVGDTARARTATTVSSLGFMEQRTLDLTLSLKDAAGVHPTAGNNPVVVAPTGFQVGRTIAVSNGTWNVGGALTYSYRWYRDGRPIVDSDAQTHVLTPGDAGTTLTARVTARSFAQGSGSATSPASAVIQVAAAPVVTGGAPSVTGNLVVGQSVHAHPGEWNVEGISFTYTWESSSDGISGWTHSNSGSSLAISSDHINFGPYFRLKVTGERQGFSPITPIYINAGKVVKGDFTVTKKPSVTSTSSKFTVASATFTPKPESVSYEWRVYNADGSSTTTAGSTLAKSGTAKKYVTLTATPHTPGFNELPVTVTAQKGTLPKPTGATSLSGTYRVGETISAPALNWTTNISSLDYKWQYKSGSSWKTIAGSVNGNSYTVAAPMLGKKIRVTVTAAKDGYTTQVTTSKTATVLIGFAPNPSFGAGEAASVIGTVAPGETVEALPGVWTPAAASYSYQWKWGHSEAGPFKPIPKATSKSTVVPTDLEGKVLVVTITAHLPGHIDSPTNVKNTVLAGALINTAKPKITKSGSVYTVGTGSWTPKAEFYDYNWEILAPNGSFQPLPLSGNSLDESTVAPNRPILVTVTAGKAGYAAGASNGNPARKGTLVPDAPLQVTTNGGTTFSQFMAPKPGWGPIEHKVAYQWQIKSGSTWVDITGKKNIQLGAREESFTPALANLVNKDIRVRMTVTSPLYTTLVAYSTSTHIGIMPAPTPNSGAGAPSFDGTPHIGQKLTVDPGWWSFDGGTFAYQWFESLNGSTPKAIVGATSKSYTIPTNRYGWHFTVRMTLSHPGITPGVAFADPGPAAGDGTLASTKAPTVSKSGSTLSVSKGSWNVAPTGYSYVWERVANNGTTTPVGTGTTYTLTGADAEQQIRVTVVATAIHYYDAQVTVIGQLGAKPQPSAPLELAGAQTLSSGVFLKFATWPANTDVTLQWSRDGKAIAGETNAIHFTVPADLGKKLTLAVTARRPGYQTSVTTLSTGTIMADVAIVATEKPTIETAWHDVSTSSFVNFDFIASTGKWTAPGTTSTYQWLRNGTPITGATSATYRTTAKDLGESISVRVTASKAFYISGIAESASWVVKNAPLDAYTEPLVTGSGKLGAPLTGPASIDSTYATTYTYIWERQNGPDQWQVIAGESGRVFTPTTAHGLAAGDYVRLTVRLQRPGFDDWYWSLDPIKLSK